MRKYTLIIQKGGITTLRYDEKFVETCHLQPPIISVEKMTGDIRQGKMPCSNECKCFNTYKKKDESGVEKLYFRCLQMPANYPFEITKVVDESTKPVIIGIGKGGKA